MKWFRTAWNWLIEQFIGYWPTIIATFVGGGGMAYLASLTDWIKPLGPIAYGAVGLVSMLILSSSYWVFQVATSRKQINKFASAIAERSSINVLSSFHESRQIRLYDFFHPFYMPTKAVHFRNCELFGPASIYLNDCSLNDAFLKACEVVLVRTDVPIVGAAAFEACTFSSCSFYRVTFLMKPETYQEMSGAIQKDLPVINIVVGVPVDKSSKNAPADKKPPV